ncbi:MAG: hypothetical protein KKF30_13280 [Proteobacteria bacterium]|nr:hypothetical protein [Pseudomonadota bacterium]MBU4470713.1 hypothetical protein [Pseudomonadota bacterium]MCG2751191.1 hypothetical protein [Desulfobacteraceae bacterium]
MSLNLLHPSENELMSIVVDGQGFSKNTYRHVEECPLCSENIRNIEASLARIGSFAERLAPEPARLPRIPTEEQSVIRWRPALVTAITIVLVLWGTFRTFAPQAPANIDPETAMMGEIWEDDRFMDEVADLSENALPEEFMDLLSASEMEGNPENTEREKPGANPRSFLKIPAMKGTPRC